MNMMGSVKTTRYEIGFYGPGDLFIPLGWTMRKTKQALLNAMLRRGEDILSYANIPNGTNEGFEWNTKTKSWEWNGFSIRFTGETTAR